jgi:hypothetical protein
MIFLKTNANNNEVPLSSNKESVINTHSQNKNMVKEYNTLVEQQNSSTFLYQK